MGFPGIWMTESGAVAYRVVPKCACSTIGQILYYGERGTFFDGDIHDAAEGLCKWSMEPCRPAIEEAVFDPAVPVFTCVRNPFRRILSAFFDKICGVQRNGRRYRGNLVPQVMQLYGVAVEGEVDQIASFRRFLLFARDTIRFRKPMEPDIHWSAQSGHVATLIANGGRYDRIIRTEELAEGMAAVLSDYAPRHRLPTGGLPRFNESAGHGPVRAHPPGAYFDDLALHLMREIYRDDFELFGYDPDDPERAAPVAAIDLEEVHRRLAG
ncbi:sulfotransferase family protein [Poseidonocella sp. HB161398]|uniref:sulfotransferase family protein n=1 Tax=Poseidonocella sp. HB161398 TaxID=2320855 RepID=UPI001109593B|nr:sulfotransferase family protein [Poseidonocella sp. HB161398]